MTDTITLPRSVVEQALEALDYAKSKIFGRYDEDTVDNAQVALVMALEQPQSVDWPEVDRLLKTVKYLIGIAERGAGRKMRNDETVEQFVLSYVRSLEQPQVEKEPVAEIQVKNGHWIDTPVAKTADLADGVHKLYTHPQPPRQPLTDAQINDHRLALAYDSEDLPDPWDFKQGVRAAERAHGIGGEK